MSKVVLCFVTNEAKFAEEESRVREALDLLERREGVIGKVLRGKPCIVFDGKEFTQTDGEGVALQSCRLVLEHFSEYGIVFVSPRGEWEVAFRDALENPSRGEESLDWLDSLIHEGVFLCDDFS